MNKQKTINYAGPWITDLEVKYVEDAVKNGFYENYRVHVQGLEDELCKFLGIKHAVTVNSGTSAIHLALASAGIGEGDEVITTDSSCVASALPILYTGATPVFVDVDDVTWTIDPEAVRKAITPSTKAILPVHWNGISCDMDALLSIADEHGLIIIEDAAPTLGAEYKGRKVGTMGLAGCFSFQGAKVAIGGQGGVMVTNDTGLFERAKILAALGRTDSRMQYWSDYVGWSYGMPNTAAAMAHAQVIRINELLKKKQDIYGWYKEGLEGQSNVKIIGSFPETSNTYCYPAMQLLENYPISREVLIQMLRDLKIDSRPAQPRISEMPMFTKRFDNVNSQRIEDFGVILPGAFNLTREDIAFVCENIIAFGK